MTGDEKGNIKNKHFVIVKSYYVSAKKSQILNTHKKEKKILSFATTWRDLVSIKWIKSEKDK